MALTRVAPAGIGSTPGTGYVIGDSFLHSRGLNATDGYYTGIVTTQSLRVIGDLEVEGTTTTLDTALTEVDKLEVGANNNTVGVAITQSGSGRGLSVDGDTVISHTGANPLDLYKYGTTAPTILMYGANGTQASPTQTLSGDVIGGLNMFGHGSSGFAGGPSVRINAIASENNGQTSNRGADIKIETVATGGTSLQERLRITSGGNIGIGSAIPTDILDIQTGSSDEVTKFKVKTAGQLELTRNHASAPYIKTLMGSGNPNIILGDSAGDKVLINGDGSSYFNGGDVGIGTANPRYPLEVNSGNLLVSGSAAGNLILEDRGVGDSSRPFYVVASDGGNFKINRSNRNASGTTTSSVNSLTLSSSGNVGIGTENPDTQLQVFGSSTTGNLKIGGGNGAGNHRVYISCTETNSYIDSYGNNAYGKLRINAAPLLLNDTGGGNVGINQTSPNAPLSFNTGTGQKIELYNSGSNNEFGIGVQDSELRISSGGNSFIAFRTGGYNGSERLRITSGGNLLLGRNTDYWSSRTVFQEDKDGRTQVLVKNDNNHASASSCIAMNAFGNSWVLDVGSSLKNGNALTFSLDASTATPTEKLRLTTGGNLGVGNVDPTQARLVAQTASGMSIAAVKDNTGASISLGGVTQPRVLMEAGASASEWKLYTASGSSYGSAGWNQRMMMGSTGQLTVANTVSSNDAAVNIYKASGDNTDKAILRVGYDAAASFEIYRIRNNGDIFAGPNQSGSDFIFQTRPTGGSITERLRIQDDGKVLVYGSLGAGYLPLGGNAASAALQIRGTTKYQGIAFGQSASNATIGIDNTKLVYTANANPANLGGGKQAAHEWWSGSSGGGGPGKLAEMTTDGDLYLGGYPLTHTVAGGSHLKLRAGDGAWGISLGMRSSQNDYAYIGFTDMNGTENIGDIFMQRTGASTGHMVFSTNNGSGGSENRLRIGNSGRLCFSPDASFAAESTNLSMTIVSNGGAVGGYPGISIRSTASGGGTNSQNGMSIVSTDGNWSLYSNAGSVHGLGILAGNGANSNNAAFYVRSDKKITMGPETSNEASTTNYCGQAVHIAGGSLGIGALSNYSTHSGQGGRDVRGWYHANAYTGRNSNAYLHLTTSLWGGGSPHGNSEFIMGGFRITSYRYSPAGTAEELIMFHNWNGGMAGYTRTYTGTWDPGSYVYERGTGFVTLRLTSQNYVGHIIDLIQYNWYPIREIRVTSANFSNTATL